MTIIICPYCNRWKFFDTKTKKDRWEKPDVYDEAALAIIRTSVKLLILVGGLEEYSEECNECIIMEKN